MRISWLLFKKSGRQSIGRLGLTVAAIGLGTLMLLSFLAGINGLMARQQRYAWQSVAIPSDSPFASEVTKQAQRPIDGVAPLQVNTLPTMFGNTSKWRDQEIIQVFLHATGDNSPEFPGMKTPRAGEYYVSPKLAEIIRQHPEDKIGERFGAKNIGTMPEQYVVSPDSLQVVRGATDEQVAAWQRSKQQPAKLYSLESLKHKPSFEFDPASLLIFSFGGIILLFPIVMFVAVATQLGSAQREQRYAALRLIGATRSQINHILLFESFVATMLGMIVGSLVYWAAYEQLLGNFTFSDMRFWTGDLRVEPVQYLIFALITLGCSLFASWRAMRKVRTSPLGVARRERLDKRPRAWRVLPLLTGVGIFTWLSVPAGSSWLKSQEHDSIAPMLLVLGGVLLVMFGLLLAGSWLTSRLSKAFANHTRRATTLLASRRITGHARTIFRSVSGLVLALFAGSFYLAAVSGVGDLSLQSIQDNGYSQLQSGTAIVYSDQLPADFEATLRKQSFISSTDVVTETDKGMVLSCRVAAAYTKHRCPAGAADDALTRINFLSPVVDNIETIYAKEVPADAPARYIVRLNGEKIDALRSLALSYMPAAGQLAIADGTRAQKPVVNPVINDLAALTYVGIGVTLFVAVASLIVSTIGGLLERRRSLFTLRLSGMTVGQMKRVVLVESLIPLISTSVLAAGAGIWVATVFLQSFSSTVRVSLSPTYFAIVGGSLLLGIIGIWLVLPMIQKITSLEQNQTE